MTVIDLSAQLDDIRRRYDAMTVIAPLSGCPQPAWDSDRARREVNGRPAPRNRVGRVTSRLFRPVPSIPMLRTTRQKRSNTMLRTIHLPAVGRTVSLAQYNRLVSLAKAFPGATFKTGLTTWWPTTAAEIMQQFREGMTDRINQAIPYSQRGRK